MPYYHSKKPEGFITATLGVVELLEKLDWWSNHASTLKPSLRMYDAQGHKESTDWYEAQTPPADTLAQLEKHLVAMQPYFDGFCKSAHIFNEADLESATDRGYGDDAYLLKQYKAMLVALPQLRADPFITDSLGKLEDIATRL